MKRIGNTASNRQYNPKNKRPPVPIDADEADSAMERFIRDKYANVERPAGGDTSTSNERPSRARVNSHSSEDEQRPAPPPKTTSKFRSMLGMSNKLSKKDREAAAKAHLESQPHNTNERRTGRGVEETSPEKFAENLAVLRDMGFRDEKKNKTILKGLNGNLQKTIDTLVRLGESSGPSSRSRSPLPSRGVSTSAGISVDRTGDRDHGPSNNPWAILDSAPPQTAQSTGNVRARNAPSLNPFDALDVPAADTFDVPPSQSHPTLNQQYQLTDQFQGLSVDSPQQALFPNRTGGIGNVQSFQRGATVPLPSIVQGQYQSFQQHQPTASANFNPFMQQQAQSTQQSNHASNPFGVAQRSATFPFALQQQQQQQQSPNPFGFTQQESNYQQSSNPFGYAAPGQQQSYMQNSNPFGGPQQQMQQQYTPQPQAQQQQTNPWATQSQVPSQQSYQQYNSQQFQAQPRAMTPQKTGINKNDILALYNQPNVPPQPYTTMTQSPAEFQAESYFQANDQSAQQQQLQQSQQRSISNPVSGYGSTNTNTNPFLNSNAAAMQTNGKSQMSRESIIVGAGGWGVQNGRHSPDAFASLSARSG